MTHDEWNDEDILDGEGDFDDGFDDEDDDLESDDDVEHGDGCWCEECQNEREQYG